MTTTRASLATRASASVDGPGIGSARSKLAWSSVWQKYCERKSSGRQMTRAPAAAASRTRAMARSRLSRGSAEQRICTRPRLKVCGGAIRPYYSRRACKCKRRLRVGARPAVRVAARTRRASARLRVEHLADDVAQQAIPAEAGLRVMKLGVGQD